MLCLLFEYGWDRCCLKIEYLPAHEYRHWHRSFHTGIYKRGLQNSVECPWLFSRISLSFPAVRWIYRGAHQLLWLLCKPIDTILVTRVSTRSAVSALAVGSANNSPAHWPICHKAWRRSNLFGNRYSMQIRHNKKLKTVCFLIFFFMIGILYIFIHCIIVSYETTGITCSNTVLEIRVADKTDTGSHSRRILFMCLV
jgi:hypothetical protein